MSKNCCDFFWRLCEDIRLLFIPTSGHTCPYNHNKKNNKQDINIQQVNLFNNFCVLKENRIFAGRGQVRAGDSEAPQACDVQGAGVPHQVRLQHRRAEHQHRLQRVHLDDGRNDCQHRSASDVHDEDRQLQRG